MALISFSQVQDGTSPQASQVNNPLTTIYNEFNGNISSVNLADNAVTTPKLADGAVTADKLSTGATTAEVLTSQTTASQTFGDNLATSGPSVTVTIGANGLALVTIYCRLGSNSTTSNRALAGINVSGANTISASDDRAIDYQVYASGARHSGSATFLFTGLSAGSTTFKMQYRVTGDTGTWLNRRITVIPL